MIVKIFLKIWPALLPIFVYLIWIYLIKKILAKYHTKTATKVEKFVGEKSTEIYKIGAFSLHNKNFVKVLYLSLILAILLVISFAFN